MTSRRSAVFIVAAAFAFAWLAPLLPARAQQAFERLLPFLIDLDGWQGGKPDGVSMALGDDSMSSATREYRRGDDEIRLTVLVGAAARSALGPIAFGVNLKTADGYALSTTVAGFKAVKTHNDKKNSGGVLIALDEQTVFSLAYQGVGEDEALALAQKFDLSGIGAAARAK
jgi:hypothetical protein